jgi:hypothetical protein
VSRVEQAGHMSAPDRRTSAETFPLRSGGRSLIASPSSTGFFLLCVAEPGSRFSPRSAWAAATSGPKRGRCDVHNGLTCGARSPTASLAVSPHPRPAGQLASASACSADGLLYLLVTRSLVARANGTARPTAKCYAGSPTAFAPAPHALCPVQIAWRSLAPNPSIRMPALSEPR